jgi:hypothetical protein
MDEEAVRTALQHYFDHSATDEDVAHEIYHEDAVVEFPQSGERFEGVENFREWRRIYPAKVDFEIRRVRGKDAIWVVEIMLCYNGGPWKYGVDILEFRGDKVSRETALYLGVLSGIPRGSRICSGQPQYALRNDPWSHIELSSR